MIAVVALVPPPSAAAAASTAVSSAPELRAALAAARPGDTIVLADGTYTGTFAASAAGTAGLPITVTGGRNAVLTTGSTGSGYALHLTASNWRLSGFSITKSAKGLVLDNSDNSIIDGVDIGMTGQEALHVRTGSSSVVIRNSVIHDTGLTTPKYGEGIYVGSAQSNWATIMGSSSTPDRSDSVLIENNTLRNTAAEGIDIKEGTTAGRVLGNSFDRAGYSGDNYADSWVDVKGNSYEISGNTGRTARLDAFQVHTALSGWGLNNTFSSNTVTGVPGFEVSVEKGATGTVVACDTTGAAAGLTNITCTGGSPAPTPGPTPTPSPSGAPLSGSGVSLDGSDQPLSFTMVAGAPVGSTVKFKVDGVYLGQDSTSPYSWPVTITAGAHTANARWAVGGETTSIDATFSAT